MSTPTSPKRVYEIPVEWIAFGTMRIEAPSLEEACEQIFQESEPPCASSHEDIRIRVSLMRENAIYYRGQPPAQRLNLNDFPPGFPLSTSDEIWLLGNSEG